MKYNEVALISLGIEPGSDYDQESLEDALDEALYKESNYFLKRDFLPKLADKRIIKLRPLCQLSEQLGVKSTIYSQSKLPEAITERLDLEKAVASYNLAVSAFKLKLTQAASPCEIIEIYTRWNNLFKAFSETFCSLYESETNGDVKGVHPRILNIDFVELHKELGEGVYSRRAKELYMTLKSQI